MMNYTYNETNAEFYRRAWDILVRLGGASRNSYDKSSFVSSYTQVEYPASEYRFCGKFGFGGKFWRNDGAPCPFYVSYYPEDRTKAREECLNQINNELKALYEELKPNPRGP